MTCRKMSNKAFGKIVLALLLLAGALFGRASQAVAQDAFEVSEIRIAGIDRIEAVSVLSNITFSRGSLIDAEVVANSIASLYATGLFRDVEIARDGTAVIITVVENPVISAIRYVGMDELDEDDINEILEGQGIAIGRVLRRGVEKDIERIVQASYSTTANYLTVVRVSTIPEEGGNVEVVVSVNEGQEIRVSEIRIFGNSAFDEDDLLDLFELDPFGLFSGFFDNDIYTESILDGDIGRLRSFYTGDGYIRFEVLSREVKINLDDFSVAIHIYIREGARYKFADPNITGIGDLIEDDEVVDLQTFEKGEVYSDVKAGRYTRALRDALRDRGYAFAEVTDSFELDDAAQQVEMTYAAEPGKLVQVRRINFVGNNETLDEVLRRQFILFEGETFSADKLNRSLLRLRRNSYLLNAQAREIPVSDTEMDIEVTVAEAKTGNITFGLGYSKSDGVSYEASYSRRNFLGSGNDLSFALSHSDSQNTFSISYQQNFFTDTGISRAFNMYLRNETESSDATSSFNLDRFGGSMRYIVPIDDNWSWNPGIEFEQLDIENYQNLASSTVNLADKFVNQYAGDPIFTNLLLGVRYDSRNRGIDPSDGMLHSFDTEIGIPPGDVKYYQLRYTGNIYEELGADFVLNVGGKVRVGGDYSDGVYPFYKRFSLGRTDLRGFKSSTIAPDGGLLLMHASVDLLRPVGFLGEAAKVGLFADYGNLWADIDSFDGGEFRGSAGVQLRIITPAVPMLFTYGIPFAKEDDDIEEKFQFAIGF